MTGTPNVQSMRNGFITSSIPKSQQVASDELVGAKRSVLVTDIFTLDANTPQGKSVELERYLTDGNFHFVVDTDLDPRKVYKAEGLGSEQVSHIQTLLSDDLVSYKRVLDRRAHV